ncbi:MAG: hypothetical protein KDA55_19055 [Planctomycetales bacterium]|nr:hypothetical protein [Planctomycetales bacterium]MCA9163265.1 hypothetical protein [Planctomycetales bacterium]MCA9202459.1 hypothetical protein [Planctomycetales bacterium]MCA9210468.1 hypothetical protein [Planctomycetales bacterium]MCA9222647.1 hypothetical protein [Planctomycetales bacterium]
MNIQQFLEHHGIARNPFAEEDAQTDPVFKEHCIASTYHPTWAKVFGDPSEPSTAVVFGEKGSGKTAMRLQIARHLEQYNAQHPDRRQFIIHYDDFNPFLDRFHAFLGQRKRADRVLSEWKLWDHMDAILSVGVTGLVDRILGVRQPSPSVDAEIRQDDIAALDRHQARDLLLLALCYDQSTAETFKGRWHKLRRKLRFWTIAAHWPMALGVLVTVAIAALAITLIANDATDWLRPIWLYLLLVAAGWCPWLWKCFKSFRLARRIVRHVRVGNHEVNPLRSALMNLTSGEIASQPLPTQDRTDDRFEQLAKLQGLLNSLGFQGIIVLMDRIDEPHLINGSAELMKLLVWPMLDNKFLKHPGLGLKLMLPIELTRYVDKEDREFYQRARLDKQNMISSFEWTGEALYDVASARLQACAIEGNTPTLRDLFDESVSDDRLVQSLRSLRVPRHLFKFLYRLLVDHCNSYTDRAPQWRIPAATYERSLAVYLRDQDALDRNMGVV